MIFKFAKYSLYILGAAMLSPGASQADFPLSLQNSKEVSLNVMESKKNSNRQEGFWGENKEGYYWYKDTVIEEEQEEEQEEERGKAPIDKKIPSLKDFTKEELWNMHPEEFSVLSERFLNKAIQSPSEENVFEYLTMQDIARRKASAFTSAFMFVNQKYEQFDLRDDYPIVSTGKNARVRQQNSEIDEILKVARKDFGLIYFTKNNCEACIEQDQVMKYFQKKYAWQVKKVNVDQSPGTHKAFNIKTIPSILMVMRGGKDYMPIGRGVVSVRTMAQNIYRGVRILRGDTTIENYGIYDFQKGSGFDPKSFLDE